MKMIFITGNQHKARILQDYLGYPVEHRKAELDEIQSLDLKQITEHKVKQAFSIVKAPVLVEDVALEMEALGKLPGPFIKWFLEEIGTEGICKLADKLGSKKATAKIAFAYFDGQQLEFFEGAVEGRIADKPRGKDFGWNPIFIPEGANKTYAEMDEAGRLAYGLRTSTVFPLIKEFLTDIDKG